MSEGEDKESKTEEASEKKVRDAVEKGNVPVSKEVSVLISFIAVFIAIAILVPPRIEKLLEISTVMLQMSGTTQLHNQLATNAIFKALLEQTALIILPIFSIFMLSGIVSSLIQNPFQITFDRIVPKFSRVSPKQGFSRIFGRHGLIEFAKSLFKFSTIIIILIILFKGQYQNIIMMMIRPPQLIASVVFNIITALLMALTVVAVVLAIVDTLWTRISWRRDLRMSKQEVKEEHRQSEGDPMIKMRIKSLARQRASRRMIAAVPKATMVITNPTHYAVAMRYVRSEGGAPIVVAKGTDLLALKIKEIAGAHGIDIIENKPLARGLYKKAEVNDVIPQEFFKAVAEIVHFIQMRKVSRMAQARR